VRGAAEYLMVHTATVHRLALKGVIGRKIGKVYRFKIEDLDAFLTNQSGSLENKNHAATDTRDAREEKAS
jgi:excisionase family DNA binding protein